MTRERGNGSRAGTHRAPSRRGRHRASAWHDVRTVPVVPGSAVPIAVLASAVLLAGVAAAGRVAPPSSAEPVAVVAPVGPTPAAPSPPPFPTTAAAAVQLAVRAAPATSAVASPGDPATWSSRQLAAQLVFSCVQSSDLGTAAAHSRAGLGGVVVMGRPADRAALAAGLARVRGQASHGIAPLVASDEEGGRVQRLKGLLGPLPSAAEMGRWPDQRIEQTAAAYGAGMRALGVQLALSPVADLAVPGAFLTADGRAFSGDPRRVAAAAVAWSRGLQRGGVLSAVKHWPGHGRAGDSHTTSPAVPPLSALEGQDLLPFDAVLGSGASIVMVGHLRSEGLTEPGLPATLSPNALRVLRGRAGPSTVLLTDSVSMAASSSALGIPPRVAALRALGAGADWAMSCVDPLGAVAEVQRALDDRRLPRAGAVASARRILAVKHRLGLLAVAPVTAPPTGRLDDVQAAGGVVTLAGSAADADTPKRPAVVRLVVDGVNASEVPADAGAFRVALPVRPGAPVCVLVLNTGAGRPTPLGCVTAPPA